MAEFDILIEDNFLPLGQVVLLKFALQHSFRGPLQQFRMHLKGSPGIQVIGSSQVSIPRIDPQETSWVEVPVKGKQIGLAEIRLERQYALLGGRGRDFPDVSFDLQVGSPDQFPFHLLGLTCARTTLNQNAWTELPLKFLNNSDIPLEGVELHLESDQFQFEEGETPIRLGFLAPHSGKIFKLNIHPGVAGELKLDIHIFAQAMERLIKNNYALQLSAKADPRSSETHIHGDVLQVGRGNVIGNNSASSITQASEKRSRIRLDEEEVRPGPSSIGEELRSTRICPHCHKLTPIGRYCDQCSYDFGT